MKDKFIKRLSLNKKSKATLKSINFAMRHYSSFLGNKPLENSTEDDLLDYIQKLRDDGNIESSIALYRSKLRQFFNFCYEETDDIKYRKLVKLLKGQIQGKNISPQDILSVEEIKHLINVATTEHDRALVSILYESGMRIGELVALKISDVETKEKEVIFHVPNQEGCKTGARTIPCLEVSGYVQDWLKCHPLRLPDSQFILLKEFAIRNHLKKLADRAQIKKPINPHSFRHSAITRSAMMGMTDIDMSYRYWGSAHSAMLNVYIHLSKEMNSDSYKRTMGVYTDESRNINAIASVCVECGKLIQAGSLCKICQDSKRLSTENSDLKTRLNVVEDQHKKDMDDMKAQMANLMEYITDSVKDKIDEGGMRENDIERLEKFADELPGKIATRKSK
ncbi:MAG: tyrosine-type recombinase/integrase [Candidatus Methanoperedens sp.]|nr:tyrosine-type recombinase/integrase [Candidatus Methanoperedens sp.]